MDDHGFDRLTRTVATRPTRRGFLGAAAVGLGGLLGLARASGVGAISPREYCETVLGGTYQNVNGTKTCVTSDTPGKNRGGVTKEETTSQKGSFNSSHPREEEDCVNNRGGSHCK
jgi:hypothetical protein